MAGTALHSDVVLPAATWYEKHDISTTDLHPFVHSFNPAITPPWETATDWDIFNRIAGSFSRMAAIHLGDAHGRHRGAAAARQPRRAGPAVRRGPRLAQGRVRADPRPHDAQAHRRRARLQPRPQQDARARAARRQARPGLEGHHVRRDRGGARARRAQRPVALRRHRGAAAARSRRPGLRGDPRAVGHDQRPPRGRRASRRWRSGRARSCATSPRAARTSRSRSPTSASSRARRSRRPSGRGSSAATGATRRSR